MSPILIIVIRQCAPWASALIAHKHSLDEKENHENKGNLHAQSLTPFWTYSPLELGLLHLLALLLPSHPPADFIACSDRPRFRHHSILLLFHGRQENRKKKQTWRSHGNSVYLVHPRIPHKNSNTRFFTRTRAAKLNTWYQSIPPVYKRVFEIYRIIQSREPYVFEKSACSRKPYSKKHTHAQQTHELWEIDIKNIRNSSLQAVCDTW